MNSETVNPASSASSATTAAAAKPDPLAFMDRLSKVVYLYRPPEFGLADATSMARPTAPTLVIVCSWMDAQPVHIAKYLAAYRDGLVFPDAAASRPPSLLLIRSNRREVFKPAQGAAAVLPAVPVMRAFLPELQQSQDEDDPPRLLVHIFSNGGGIMLNHLYNALGAVDNVCLPRHVTVFDSCPGRFRYTVAVATMTVGLSHRPLLVRLATLSVVHPLVIGFWLRTRWRRLVGRLAGWLKGSSSSSSRTNPTSIISEPEIVAESVLDDAWYPHNKAGGPNRIEVRRAYLYSRDDQLVAADDVELHADEAREQGFTVAQMVKFASSGHVTHARTDPVRYWQTVREVWAGIKE